MANEILGQLLGTVLGGRGGSMGHQGLGASDGGLGGLLGGLLGGSQGMGNPGGGIGGLGNLGNSGGGLGGMLGGLAGGMGGMGSNSSLGGLGGVSRSGMGGHNGAALTALLLPLAMQWVQRNGGIGGVLERFQQKGYAQQASSWVSTGDNHPVPAQAMGDVVGSEELSRLSQQLGVSNEEVAGGMAEVLPEVVNHLTPDGHVPRDSDNRLNQGVSAFDQFFRSQQR